jgi:uncharacterized iron-regulated protein
VKTFFDRTGRRLLIGILSALASACAAPAAQDAIALGVAGKEFVLGRAFADFYDTAFVLTDGGKTPPHLVDIESLAENLAAYDVIFFGEKHRHPGIHLQQQRLLRALHARAADIVLSLEQFERDVQPVLDDYLAGRIGENNLIEKGRAWDNYRTSYRPLVQFAKDNGLPVVAAEAPAWAVTCVGQYGLEILQAFTPQERAYVARDLHVIDGAYRDKYSRFLSGSSTHGGGQGDGKGGKETPESRRRAENSYAAQVLRDDTMAESIASVLQRFPGKTIFHLNGSFHSDGFLGTVERLRLRKPEVKIAVISPVEVGDPRTPAFPKSAAAEGTVLQLVYPDPIGFVEGEDQSEWVRSVMAKRASSRCKYSLVDSSREKRGEGETGR